LISRRLPAFALGRNPDLKIIATSYSADRALDFSGDVQRIMDSESYHALFPETRIVGQFAKIGEAKRAAALFEVAGRRGRYRAAGIGGGITGEPADILIIDDPIKDFSEAISDTIRESIWNWLTSTAMTRLQEGGGVIVMATRWHLDDPIGRLLERQPGRWKLMNFRAIAEEDEPPYRLADEPLSVERFGLDALIQIRDGGAMNRYQWAAHIDSRVTAACRNAGRHHAKFARNETSISIWMKPGQVLIAMAKWPRHRRQFGDGRAHLSPNYLRKDQLLLDTVAFGLLRSPR
jgi:Terminase large subunit, T4likevirus-type, N-terminal